MVYGSHLLTRATGGSIRQRPSGPVPLNFPMPQNLPSPSSSAATVSGPSKSDLRRALRHRRKLAAETGGAAAALALRDHLLRRMAASWPSTGVVAGYWPMGDEMDVRPLLSALAERGLALALPVVVGPDRPLIFRAWAPGEALEAGPHGTCHPMGHAPEVRPALVLVPLLGFDRAGRRLGYGGGYYDRTLSALRGQGGVTALGVAFAAQEIEDLPAESHDQRLDGVMTEQGWLDISP